MLAKSIIVTIYDKVIEGDSKLFLLPTGSSGIVPLASVRLLVPPRWSLLATVLVRDAFQTLLECNRLDAAIYDKN